MTKKLTKPYIAALLLLCLVLVASVVGGFAVGNVNAETTDEGDAANSATTVTLSGTDDFDIDEDGLLTGLTEQGAAKAESAETYEAVIPASVKLMQLGIFGNGYSTHNTKLVKLSFEEGSECLGLFDGDWWEGALAYCTALKVVDLSNAVKLQITESEWGGEVAPLESAFYECSSLETVIFPEALEDNATLQITDFAFYGTAIKEFTIPAYVDSIASSAFTNCTQFETITIAEGNTTFTYYTDADGNPYDMAIYTMDEEGKPNAFVMAPYKMEKITLPQFMVTLAAGKKIIYTQLRALNTIGGLKTVVVPENDEVYVYGNALWLKETSVSLQPEDSNYHAHDAMFIPFGVDELEIPKEYNLEWGNAKTSCFWNMFSRNKYSDLKAINVEEGNTAYNSYTGVLYSADYSNMLIPQAIEELTIPKEVTNFDFEALEDCSKLKSIDVEEGSATYVSRFGVIYSADYSEIAFIPQDIEELTIPKEVTNFDFTVLLKYPNIKTTSVEEGNTTYVSRYDVVYSADYSKMVYVPQGLEELIIPKEVTNFDFTVLLKYPNIKTTSVEEGNTTYVSRYDVVYSADYSKMLYVPQGLEELIIPKEATNIDSVALANCRSIKSIVIEDGNTALTSVDGAIYDSGMTELFFVPSVATEYYAPATLEKIGENVFAVYDEKGNRTRNKIEKVYVTDIEKWAQVQFGDPIETAEQYEQDPIGKASLERRKAVVDGLQNGYGPNPMSGGAQMYVLNGAHWMPLEDLVLDFDGQISDMAFVGCTTLLSVTISDKVTRIGEMSFAGCVNLRDLTVPYVGVTKEFKLLYTDGDATDYHGAYGAYLWDIFGGKGWNFLSGGASFDMAPAEMESVTITGYNIWKAYDYTTGTIGATDGEYHYGFGWTTLRDTPANKLTISIDNTDGHVIEAQWGILNDSSVKVVDLKNSKISKARDGMFAGAYMEEITVPETLVEIPSYLFSNATTLKKVVFPEGVKYVGIIVFTGTESLYTVTFPSTIEGFWGGYGDKSALRTIYLTGSNKSENYGYAQFSEDGPKTNYVAVDADVYNHFIEVLNNNVATEFNNRLFYEADVVFEIKDANGNVLATKTERHLASALQDRAVLKYGQVASHSGYYWDIVEDYALPDTIGYFKVDNTKWTLDGNAVTADTILRGNKATYTITQTLEGDEDIPIMPVSVQKEYDGKNWTPYPGISVTKYICTEGGNGFNTNFSKVPVDVGTYTVKAKCASGYKWADGVEVNSEGESMFTLTITPVKATLEWYYLFDGEQSATNVTGTVPSRVYNGIETRGNMYAIFKDINGVERTVNSSAYSLYAAGDRENVVKMNNAGLYDFVVYQRVNSADNQVWLGNYEFENSVQQFRITPYVIDLSDYDNLAWGLDGYNSYLLDRDLYIYNGIPYAYEQADKGTPVIRSVNGSVVRLRELAETEYLTIVIANIPSALDGNGRQYTAVYSNNKAKNVGIYTAQATLTAMGGNYEFTYGLGIDLLSRGITIAIDDNGIATITKTWYVVAIDNGMLNVDGEEYFINDWTYGRGTAIDAPRLEHGDEDDKEYLSNNNVTFTLRLNGVEIVKDFKRSVFKNYINPSMPAGRYELICTVHSVTVGNHTHWWDNEEHNTDADNGIIYHGFTRTLIFNVVKAEIDFTLNKSDGGYAGYEWEYNAENKANAFAKFVGMLNANVVKLVKVERSGYWAEDEANKYYGGYALTYNFAKMNNEMYLSTGSEDLLKNINGVDTYTVYFQITAPNHNNLTDTHVDGRYNYYFTVTVYTEIATPVVSSAGLVYTGNKVLPDITESELYETIWIANDTYVNGGQHSVAFKLYDNVHYRWAGVTTDTVSVNFTISKANNDFTVALNMLGWNYETFDAAVNNIRATMKFLDDGQSIHFRVTKKGETTAVTGLSDFAIDANGKVDATVADLLKALKVGDYTLYAKVNGTANYNEIERNIDFKVSKDLNTWADGDEDLVLPSWIVGKFSLEDNPIVVKAAHGEAIIEIRDIDGNVYYTSTNPEENTLNTLEVGKYLLVAWVPESEDYAALAERSFTIEVLKKIGLPWWGTTLVTVGALGLAAAIILILWKLKVFEILTDKISLAITTRATIDATIAAIRATKTAEEAEAHKRKVEARERLEAAREAYRNKTPEERAQALQERAEATATKADEMHAKAGKMRERADKMSGKSQQAEQPEQAEEPAADETPTEE